MTQDKKTTLVLTERQLRLVGALALDADNTLGCLTLGEAFGLLDEAEEDKNQNALRDLIRDLGLEDERY